MTTFKLGRWLLVALAIIGLALVVPAVGAHGNETVADDERPDDGTAADWAAWMEGHMVDHMGPGSIEWMEWHMGLPIEEMAQDRADDRHYGGRYGQGHC